MTEKLVIRQSKRYYTLRYAIVVAVCITLIILTFVVLRGARSLFGLEPTLLGWIIRILIVTLAFVVIIFSRKGSGDTYRLDGNKLSVTEYWLGAKKSEEVIMLNPKSIHTVRMKQKALDKLLNSGTLSIEMENVSYRVYYLYHIANPRVVMQKLLALT